MKKQFPTFIDETAEMYDSIIVSGGRIGLQIDLAPIDLARITNAVFCDLILTGINSLSKQSLLKLRNANFD